MMKYEIELTRRNQKCPGGKTRLQLQTVKILYKFLFRFDQLLAKMFLFL